MGKLELPKAVIYTDGACLGNPGPGGWAVVVKKQDEYREFWGGEKYTTNNRMELRAVIEGLKSLKKPHKVILITDSKYIYNAINEKWLEKWKKNKWVTSSNTPVKNKDLWEKLIELFNIHKVNVKWTPAHRGNLGNERCDFLAKKAAEQNR